VTVENFAENLVENFKVCLLSMQRFSDMWPDFGAG
jgi:hypothetical protein